MEEDARRGGRPTEAELGGFKYLEAIGPLLARLRGPADPKRNLHHDQYAVALLFYFFNPTLTSLRGLQGASNFASVQRKLGIPRMSLGSLSAAQHTLEPELLVGVLHELLSQLPPDKGDPRLREISKIVTLVDGTLLKALPRMAWALWLNDGKRSAKAHVQYELVKGGPSLADVTAANASERDTFAKRVEGGRFYVTDSGYASFLTFSKILAAGSSFLCRLPNGWAHTVVEERELTEADREARVTRDLVVELGGSSSRQARLVQQPLRLVEIEAVEEPSKRMRALRGTRKTIVLVTDRLDLSADLLALLYSARWTIEIFFRWLKCTLGCKHLLAESQRGVTLQLYVALIACLLISLWTGKKPTKRVYEAICLYLQGFADLEEVLSLVERLKPHNTPA